MGYDPQAILNDMERIKIVKTKEKLDQGFCELDDYITVHWKGYLGKEKVEDSMGWFHKPKVFRLGHYQVTKCWDIALQQVR
jgi:FKBP-type peptidyl-prolyl cis-trans isomerase